MRKLIDLTGQIFGKWTVLRYESKSMWRCRCTCGEVHQCSGNNLRCGLSTACRTCSNRVISSNKITHGRSKTPMFVAWFAMIQRCENKAHRSYHYYGGRGIKVCERWKDFSTFLADMGERPAKHTLDRRNNDGDYEPGNCRWVKRKTQMRNTRANRMLMHDGQRKTLAEWSEITGLNTATIWDRLHNGWSVEKALTTKPRR